MSSLSDLEKKLGLSPFDISFFKETKIDSPDGTEKPVPSGSSASTSNKTSGKPPKKDKINVEKKQEPQTNFNDILSESQRNRIEKMLKYIQ